jgi:hypothetical protein
MLRRRELGEVLDDAADRILRKLNRNTWLLGFVLALTLVNLVLAWTR